MFVVGLGFDRAGFGATDKGVAAVSLAGMAAPFLLAVLLAPWLLGMPGLCTPVVTRLEATLFLGAAIAITAFPMLARIIHECGLSGTRLGTLCLSAGAIDDAGAWLLIALMLASFGDGPGVALLAAGSGLAFAGFAVLLAPRLLAPLARGELTEGKLAVPVGCFLLAAFAMDAVGLHAVFGGFLLGTAIQRGRFAEQLRAKLEPVTVVLLLLPLFLTFSGLNTELLMLGDAGLAALALVVLVASVLAKGVACYGAARLAGEPHRDALGIGALMNARGLMELILINIGLQRGVIEPPLFAMLVLMAIITTLMASPLFQAFQARPIRFREVAIIGPDPRQHP